MKLAEYCRLGRVLMRPGSVSHFASRRVGQRTRSEKDFDAAVDWQRILAGQNTTLLRKSVLASRPTYHSPIDQTYSLSRACSLGCRGLTPVMIASPRRVLLAGPSRSEVQRTDHDLSQFAKTEVDLRNLYALPVNQRPLSSALTAARIHISCCSACSSSSLRPHGERFDCLLIATQSLG